MRWGNAGMEVALVKDWQEMQSRSARTKIVARHARSAN